MSVIYKIKAWWNKFKIKIKSWLFFNVFSRILKYKYKWNPFMKYPRNETCYCGSGLKYKKCCLNNEPIYIREDFAKKASKLVKTMRRARKNVR